MDSLSSRVTQMNEKMYDFEQNKRNNLIFYGLPSDHEETPESLALSVQRLLKEKMLLKREMIITQVHTVTIRVRNEHNIRENRKFIKTLDVMC